MVLDNFTGFELTQSEYDELNEAACELVDSLPQQFQDSFKIYDFGFYVYNENMAGGVDSILNEALLNIPGHLFLFELKELRR